MIKKNNIKFIDLGLPSGILWGDRNLGAKTIYDFGLYYQWGSLNGFKGNKNSLSNSLKHYSEKISIKEKVGSNLILKSEYDISTVELGKDCKTPSKKDFKELIEYTYRKWDKSTHTRILISKINNVKIIFPAGGNINVNNNIINDFNRFGDYWSSTVEPVSYYVTSRSAIEFFFNSGTVNTGETALDYGLNIRPVKKI